MSNKKKFITNSGDYKKYRLVYPDSILDIIKKHIRKFDNALDVATGSGQLAIKLSEIFEEVDAVDYSQAQLDNAYLCDNIEYALASAEDLPFSNKSFDLVSIAQALHWVDRNMFFSEVKRLLKKEGVFLIVLYDLPKFNNKVDRLIEDFCFHTMKDYWGFDRKELLSHYIDYDIPFELQERYTISDVKQYSKDDLIGLMKSWSVVSNFIDYNLYCPVDRIKDDIYSAWKGEEKYMDALINIHLLIYK
ncbi:MAG: class I SAM-dependent methyltransferase [Hyphomicrobiales bacterium]